MTKDVLLDLIEQKKFNSIHDVLSCYNSVDLSELLEQLDEKDMVVVFRMLSKEKAADVFSYMDKTQQQTLIKGFSEKEITDLLTLMYTDDSVDFLTEVPSNVVTKLLESVDYSTRADINKLLKYDDDTAGSIMTTEYITLKPEMTVGEALDKIRHEGINSETVYTCYVVDKRKLVGIVTAKDIMIHDSDTRISEIESNNFISINTNDDRETAANLFRKYGLIAIPVVDSENCIVGIVTFDDAIDVLTEEATEDIHKMAAISPSDEGYLETSVWNHAKHRILWLLFLMLSATITGTIISRYENAFAAVPLLVSFIPMLMDTGGNCGSQSSTLVIRGLAVGDIKFKDTFKVLWKEFRVSLMVSVALALVNGLRIWWMYKNPMIAIVVSLSLICTIILAKLVGSMLPILAQKCRLDPAIMASPLITTIIDTCSTLIYFTIATSLLHIA